MGWLRLGSHSFDDGHEWRRRLSAGPHDAAGPGTAVGACRPRVQLPNRQYLLHTGPIHAAMAFVNDKRQTANLWWPQHHGWCVASEIDLPWTYLGGPESLIETVLADTRLEAMPARPEDPIHFRLQGWLDTLVADATVELPERGTATLTTWRGSVHATLTRPTAVAAGLAASLQRCGRQRQYGRDV